jgi:ABC-type transport system substrate-binding protein
VNAFSVTFVDSYATALGMVQRGEVDYTPAGGLGAFDSVPASVRRSKRFFRRPGVGLRYVVFNAARPPFRGNVALRQAVNFALDRPALVREEGGSDVGRPFDHYLPPIMPGHRSAHIYPLRGPDLKRARSLARGHRRGGQVVLYTRSRDPYLALAQIVSTDLERIGLHVTVKSFPGPELFRRIGNPRERWDLTFIGFAPDYIDPYSILNVLFDGRRLGKPGNFDLGRFSSATYNRLLGRAAQLRGAARYRAYGRLDLDLARNAAPLAVYANEAMLALVSQRTACTVFNPFLDLAAVCLK